ncbi:glycosyltransferase family 2 protein [Halobacteria archaeon AArc-m2/3/4]|uniref:Glycosyltransferase family 2 protein n=1 Tax=Natronoglomus mannanivorans TaxID=2979990 RepID=A0ABT2QJ79_9EURY|nr:glycosyltransferase family 2 protein [Halobacteria archaeon AArc-m2/3/4]
MTDSEPLVSVIIPTHNRPQLLERAVESVLDQTYDNLELLVVDDASDERTDLEATFDFAAIADYEYIYLDENRGGAEARNVGLDASTGEYLAFLDDDDEWLPEKIEQQVDLFKTSSDDVGLVYTAVLQRDETKEIEDVHFNPVPNEHLRDLMLKQYIGTMSSVMIRSAVLERVDGLNEEFPCWHDWEFYFRVGKEFGFDAVNKPLVRQYAGVHEQISDDFEAKQQVSKLLLEETFSDTLEEYGVTRAVRGSQLYSLSHSAYRSGRPLRALSFLLRAIAMRPFVPKYYKYLVLYSGGKRIQRWLH